MRSCFPVILSLAFLTVQSAHAEAKLEGYLCCNMRSDGSWISDINYIEAGKKIIPAGVSDQHPGRHHQRPHYAGHEP